MTTGRYDVGVGLLAMAIRSGFWIAQSFALSRLISGGPRA